MYGHVCVYSPREQYSNHLTNNNNESWLKRVLTQKETPINAEFSAKHFDVSHNRSDFNKPFEGTKTKSYKKGRQIR